MQASANSNLEATTQPKLDRLIAQIDAERDKLKTTFSTLYGFASVLFVLAVLFLVVVNAALPPKYMALNIMAIELFCCAAISALIAAGKQTKFILKNKPLQLCKEVRAGLLNAGFVYGNHSVFFQKFWVFRAAEGDGVAVTNILTPLQTEVYAGSAFVSLKLDGKQAFVGRIGEVAPQIEDFKTHPEYRYRDKNKPVCEVAELSIYSSVEKSFAFKFPFNSANKDQFVAFVHSICI